MVRSAVDRNPREHRYRTAALYAVLPALSHFATLPTSTEYTAPRLKAEQKRTGRATGAVTVTEIVIRSMGKLFPVTAGTMQML